MTRRAFERKKRRMPCNVTFEGRQHNGLVIDLSPGGLFVQTNAKAQPGDRLDLKLSLPGETHKLPLQVEVVRKIVVPPRLLAVAHGGVGVRILNAPETYYNFMEALEVGPDVGESKAESNDAETSEKDAAAGARPQQSYRVRAKQTLGPRSRIVDVTASSEEDARNRALAELGQGWQVLRVELK
jgi:Tfp pilus assembly protein PilZ